MPFRWHPDDPPPLLEEHSKAKLNVLRSYLRAYYDKLSINPAREEFKLDLIDGFSGGGTFQYDDTVVSGTPLIMIEESEAAQERLNRHRTKPLRCDVKYYFVDADALHTEHLRKVLDERGYNTNDESIFLRNSRFEDEVDRIITMIRRRQPRAGRAIFLLDQTGFSGVELALVARIFRELPTAEIILTFAADALINHLTATPAYFQAVSPLELTKTQIYDLIQRKDGAGGRALIQRVLRKHIRSTTEATYDTPFFIRPRRSRRALWFLHLSRHPTARDVMIQQHWDVTSTFEHYGSGDFEMLGWDALKSTDTLRLFHFEEFEAKQMREQLLNSLPAELYTLAANDPVTVQKMRHAFANKTAARFSDLDGTVLELARGKEIEILNADGKVRSRALQRLGTHDRIALPKMSLLSGLSFR